VVPIRYCPVNEAVAVLVVEDVVDLYGGNGRLWNGQADRARCCRGFRGARLTR